ncbi:MAG TPA: hypothetical protein VKP11_07260 [Frankiaceae bacterium]|nr:hypothetical protein [Frankiaceae bacterium]
MAVHPATGAHPTGGNTPQHVLQRRLTQLRTLLGEELDHPTTRFELEIALRAVRPQPTRPD